MDVKPGVLDALSRAHAAERDFLASLSDEERSAASSAQRWSAKDLVAHLAVWKQRLARSLAAMTRGSAPVADVNVEAENAAIFEESRDLPWAPLEDMLRRAQAGLAEQAQVLKEEDWLDSRRFAWQNSQPYWRLIVIDGYWHPILHLAQFHYDRDEAQCLNERVESDTVHLRQIDPSIAWQGRMLYDLACFYALSRQKGNAIAKLRDALRLDPALTEWSRKDTDLSPLHGDPAYEALYRRGS